MAIDYISTGGSPFRVMVDGVEAKTHNTLHKALATAAKLELEDPTRDVRVQQVLDIRVEAEIVAPPPPDGGTTQPPPPDPGTQPPPVVVPPPPSGSVGLLGGLPIVGNIEGTMTEADWMAQGWSDAFWLAPGGPKPHPVDLPGAEDGKALKFEYPAGSRGCGTISRKSFGAGPLQKFRIEYRVYYPAGFDTSVGYKHFYWSYPGNSLPTGYWHGTNNEHFVGYEGSAFWRGQATVFNDAKTSGGWIHMVTECEAESAYGAGDGKYRFYLNGNLEHEDNTVNWSTAPLQPLGFDGLHWYNSQNGPFYGGGVWYCDYLRVRGA